MAQNDAHEYDHILDGLRDDFLTDAQDHPELRQLPPNVAIISLDKTLEVDLAEVITAFALA